MQGKAAAAAGSAKMGRTFLVVASDGLWDVVQEGRVAGLMAKAVAEEPGELGYAEPMTVSLSERIGAWVGVFSIQISTVMQCQCQCALCASSC